MSKLIISTFVFTFFMAMGMPAAHGLSGREFGEAVNGLAKSYPGAVADHVSNK